MTPEMLDQYADKLLNDDMLDGERVELAHYLRQQSTIDDLTPRFEPWVKWLVIGGLAVVTILQIWSGWWLRGWFL